MPKGLCALTVWLLMGWSTAAALANELPWPMPIAPALSSSFGESRTTAFHAGIDIKTWGRTGYEVQAIDDGHIERVRTSPWGYGRAVYQRLSDGRIAVYAHLEAFVGPALQRFADLGIQPEQERFSRRHDRVPDAASEPDVGSPFPIARPGTGPG